MTSKRERQLIRKKIRELKSEGKTDSEIAKDLNVHINTVRNWKYSTRSTDDLPRPGRPSKIDVYTTLKINELIKDKWNMSPNRAAQILNNSAQFKDQNKTIHRTTILRHIRKTDWGRQSYSYSYNDHVLKPYHKENRVKFCKLMIELGFCEQSPKGEELRSHLMFTDESAVLHRAIPSRNIRIRTNDLELTKVEIDTSRQPHIMVAGGLCRNGLTKLIICPEKDEIYKKRNFRINNQTYIKFLAQVYVDEKNKNESVAKRKLFDDPDKVWFMQDGSSTHIHENSIEFLRQHFFKLISRNTEIEWPSQSPDLNPLENLWGILKQAIYEKHFEFEGDKKKDKRNKRKQLADFITDIWNKLDRDRPELITKLVDSFPKRILKCLELNGELLK
jgi:transposase